ncbi:flagellar hook-basal body protein [Schinkia azotoformans]|nr:flagellar hook-basal body protein [Schinkia azotoformans]MEC1697398.1 flagellar hook-basal body protein [Schinkia azotoformans]MEC1714287.1 flagellar hook-basal body protein [Schinkia azotoformans]MEC1723417.1 flagellar hook-basal body protein [Schinkia azotoformans]MEC1741298.1 flagellar hook-basal body protein [Schinkia azotoformans]MEC1743936.1 flagellar hook-basal body protein [Schinkia azotoformans]
MNRSMLTASVTMAQLQKKIDTIGHNLANSNTNGYKSRETNFNDLLFQQINNQPNANEEIGRRTPNGIRQGSGAKLSETNLRMEQGSIKSTDRSLDLALKRPNDFFELLVEENGDFTTRYTRDGAFYLSPYDEGEMALVTSNGDFVLGTNGEPIFVPENFKDIKFSESGEVIVTNNDNTEESLGQLQLVQVLRPQLLQATGENQFALPDLEQLNLLDEEVYQVVEGEEGLIQQMALEMSNVDTATEMTELLTAQRSYQFNAKSISIADQMAGLISNLR